MSEPRREMRPDLNPKTQAKNSMLRKAAILLRRINESKSLAPYIDAELHDMIATVGDRLFEIHNRGFEVRAEFGLAQNEPVANIVGQFPAEQQAMLERFQADWLDSGDQS